MIGIINYGMGNLASVANALDFLNISNKIIAEYQDLKHCDKLILPGVGAFGMAMQFLNDLNFSDEIKELVLNQKKPLLGICLGMQLLLEESSEHGTHEGLGFIQGKVKHFNTLVKDLPLPHMGWNDVEINNSRLFNSSNEIVPCFYFVHNYYCDVTTPDEVSGLSDYGIKFHAMVEKDNVFGCQFHPEKSQKSGLAIYTAFDKL
jgi:imidazole glycerol-phosphate synthase subunit HisH